MKASGIALLLALASCNSILGVKDLSGGDDSADAGPDAGDDGSLPTVSLRFVLVTPDIFELDPGAQAQLFANGTRLVDAPYGQATLPVDVPISTTEIQVRGADGMTLLRTAPIAYDEDPSAGQRAIVVLAGNLSQSEVAAPDYLHATGFNEDLLPSGGQTFVKVVHAIADRPGDEKYAITYPGQQGIPFQLGGLGMGNGQEVPSATELRVRFGASVNPAPGSEEVSFTIPSIGSGEKVLLIAAGRQFAAELDRDPGLALHLVPLNSPATKVRPDPAYFVANFVVDWANENLALHDVSTGDQLSGSSDQRSVPMLAFVPPSRAAVVQLEGFGTPLMFNLPAAPAGRRSFIALTGYKAPTAGQPSLARIVLDELDESPSGSEANVAFVHASPDPIQVNALCHNLDNAADYPFGLLSFGGVDSTTIPTNVVAQFRIFLQGSTTPLRSFNSEIEGRRQITVLSGVETGSSETLRTTNVVMRAWPWEMNAPAIGQ